MSDGTVSVYARVPDPQRFALEFGAALARSGMFGCQNPEQGQVFALAMLCENKTPTELARKYHIIGGKLSKRADAMLAEFREAGGKHRVIERTPEVAEIELLPPGGDSSKFRLSFEDAKQEAFVWADKQRTKLKDNWSTPRMRMQMLWARVCSDGIRCVMPEIVAGTYTPEEIGDLPGIPSRVESVSVQPMTDPVVVTSAAAAAAESAPTQAGEEITDAEFSPVVTEAQVSAAERDLAGIANAKQPERMPQPEPQHAYVSMGDGWCSGEQQRQIIELVVMGKIPIEAQDAIKRKRNVHDWRNLTAQQADELIATLRAKLNANPS